MKIIQLLQTHNDQTWQGMLLGLGDDGIVYEQGISGWNPVIFPNKATQSLIAAAPQMLEALESVADWGGDPNNYLNLDEVRAALRAAKGGK